MRGQFQADVLELLTKLDNAACSGYLPVYLPPGADVTRMTRTVRMIGEVRRGPPTGEADTGPDGTEEQGTGHPLYALPAEQGQRTGTPEPWEQVTTEHRQLIVLADPGMGKSWLIRTETHRLAAAAAGLLAAQAPTRAMY